MNVLSLLVKMIYILVCKNKLGDLLWVKKIVIYGKNKI